MKLREVNCIKLSYNCTSKDLAYFLRNIEGDFSSEVIVIDEAGVIIFDNKVLVGESYHYYLELATKILKGETND